MEQVVLVDNRGAAVGVHPKSTVHGRTTPRHLAFSCHVVGDDGRVLVTRRALAKTTWPGVWTNAFCGHPAPGESLEDAVRRRARFELGLEVEILSCPLPDFGYTARDASGVVENEHCPVFVTRARGPLSPNPDEVAEVAWTTAGALERGVDAAPWAFSPWLVEHLPQLAPALRAATTGAPDPSGADAVSARLEELMGEALRRAERFGPASPQLWRAAAGIALGGERIRSRLLLDAHTALGGRGGAPAVDAACAVELLHAALVIHDDVIDGDLTRRGRENVAGTFEREARALGAARRDARAWGEASSLLAGDLLLTEAHALLAGLDVSDAVRRASLDLFRDTIVESAAGEHADVRLSMRLSPAGPDDVLAMIEQKTAAYSFRAPLRLAGILAAAPAQMLDAVDVTARRIGVIYQLRDDVLGTFGSEAETGKSSLSDLREGKETLLISYARSHPEWEGVRGLFGDDGLTAADGERVRAVVERSGARGMVERIIGDACRDVEARIADAALPQALADLLREVTHACAHRSS